jgi:hypothetical protein
MGQFAIKIRLKKLAASAQKSTNGLTVKPEGKRGLGQPQRQGLFFTSSPRQMPHRRHHNPEV